MSHYTLRNEVQVIKGKIIKKNDLKGIEMHFELSGGSSYQGFKLLRVKLHQIYGANPGEINFGSI